MPKPRSDPYGREHSFPRAPLSEAAELIAALAAVPRNGCVWPGGPERLSCRAPTIEFCGEPVASLGGPYCAAHKARAHCADLPATAPASPGRAGIPTIDSPLSPASI